MEEETLVEERKAEMISPRGAGSYDRKPTKRKAFFLKPPSRLHPGGDSVPPQHDAIPSDIQKAKGLSTCSRWWFEPQHQWLDWVKKMEPTYKDVWKRAGIYGAVIASTLMIRKERSSLWAMVRFWREDTNTFVFPWGEATVTLQDTMILGGFSVVGEPARVGGPLEGDLRALELEFDEEVHNFRRKFGLSEHHLWIKHYCEGGGGDEMEHVAFLALWLSRYVLRSGNGKRIRNDVTQIACRLARGIRVALAPPVLANIYKDLRLLKEQLTCPRPGLTLCAAFNILQLWIWERFLDLRPGLPRVVSCDESRAATWHDMGKWRQPVDFCSVVSILESPKEFQWQPYSDSESSIYKNDGRWVNCVDAAQDDEQLRALAMCLRDCELVGLDCVEQYLPHRVARQFGLDQDVPKTISRVNSAWKVAWRTYDVQENVRFYVPGRHYKSAVTQQYAVWWKSGEKKERVAEMMKKKRSQLPLRCNTKNSDFHADKSKGNAEESVLDQEKSEPEAHKTEERKAGVKKRCSEMPLGCSLKKKQKGVDADLHVDKTKCNAEHHEKPETEMQRTEERDPETRKELERDMKINQLKQEIASILAEIRYWESLANADSNCKLVSSS